MRYRLVTALRLVSVYYALISTVSFGPLYGQAPVYANKYSDGQDVGIMIMGTIGNKVSADSVALVKEMSTGRVRAVKSTYDIAGFKVKEVTSKYILLTKADFVQLVYLNKFAGEFSRVNTQPPPAATFTATQDSYSEDGLERKGNKVVLSSKLRDKLIGEDLSAILMQATAIPVTIGGEIVGFRVLQIDAGSIYDKAGLRDNDVIVAINGIKLNSIPGAVKLLKSLRGTAKVDMDLQRNGSHVTIELNVAH